MLNLAGNCVSQAHAPLWAVGYAMAVFLLHAWAYARLLRRLGEIPCRALFFSVSPTLVAYFALWAAGRQICSGAGFVVLDLFLPFVPLAIMFDGCFWFKLIDRYRQPRTRDGTLLLSGVLLLPLAGALAAALWPSTADEPMAPGNATESRE
jgi:hypothetical protein